MDIMTVLEFGKYKGKELLDVMKTDIGYIDYLISKDEFVVKYSELVKEIHKLKAEDAERVENGEASIFTYKKRLTMPFGKYKDWHIKKIVKKDPGYVEWFSKQEGFSRLPDIADYVMKHRELKQAAEAIRTGGTNPAILAMLS